MKYITYDNGMCKDVVIFSSLRQHQDIALAMGIDDEDIYNAGFVTIQDGVAKAYGESISLNKTSDPKDSDFINRFLDG